MRTPPYPSPPNPIAPAQRKRAASSSQAERGNDRAVRRRLSPSPPQIDMNDGLTPGQRFMSAMADAPCNGSNAAQQTHAGARPNLNGLAPSGLLAGYTPRMQPSLSRCRGTLDTNSMDTLDGIVASQHPHRLVRPMPARAQAAFAWPARPAPGTPTAPPSSAVTSPKTPASPQGLLRAVAAAADESPEQASAAQQALVHHVLHSFADVAVRVSEEEAERRHAGNATVNEQMDLG